MISRILLSKLAHDAGFDVELGEADGWLAFGVPGRPLRIWLYPQAEGAVVAFSRADVLRELDLVSTTQVGLPPTAVGAGLALSPDDVLALLIRARVLDRTLPHALLEAYQAAVAQVDATEAIALVKQRRGQDLFRSGLLDYWQGCCAITGLNVPELLRASHAKPWKDSTDSERLDVHNGLLLAAHMDAAFDQGLIAVGDDGVVIVSSALSNASRATLGLTESRSVKRLTAAHQPYLAWHRTNVFRKSP